MNWEDLKLSAESLELVKKSGYERPTPVQAQTIPFALEGRDVIASAQTGTGKTASFVLPMVERMVGRQGTYGLILAPTREIAQQNQATIEQFGGPRGIRSIVLIGGVDYRFDEQALATYPHIIVATPGRLCDHLDRGNIWLEFLEVVVLDEADRMLDMGFSDQLSRIMDDVPAKRQTMLFSATFPPSVEKLARKILHDPERVAIGKPQSTATSVEQRFVFLDEASKMSELRRIIQREKGSMIVFTRSKDGATRVWRSLHSSGIYDATYIHSDRLQAHRESALAEFKEGKFRILVATDVAGRGIHVENVAQVVNYDLPMEPEDYIHRIGRTGRAGATGHATTFVTPRDRGMVRQLERLLGKSILSEQPEGSPERSHAGGEQRESRGGRGEERGGGRRGARGGRDRGPRERGPSEHAGPRGGERTPGVGPTANRVEARADVEPQDDALEQLRAVASSEARHAGPVEPAGNERERQEPPEGDKPEGEGGGKRRRRRRKRKGTGAPPKGNTPAFPV